MSPSRLPRWDQGWLSGQAIADTFADVGRHCHRDAIRFYKQRRHARYFILQLAESPLTRHLFGQIVGRIERLAWQPT